MAPRSKKKPGLQRATVLEITLLVVGAGLATIVLKSSFLAAVAQRQAGSLRGEIKTQPQARERSTGKESIVPDGTFGTTYLSGYDGNERAEQVIGQLNIPALGLAVPIISGITNADLTRGVGHIQGTGYAGGLGNMAVAGHRDTFFRPLRRVEPGMLVGVSSSSGSYHYKVDRTEIVSPEQLRILDIGDHPQLTMITCYPFDFIGAAPSRFIVFAHLVSAAPDAQKN